MREGLMLQEHIRVSQMVLQYGYAVPINDAAKEKREKLGMKPVPETVCMYPEALQDVRTLLELCGFDKLCASQTPA